MLSIDSLCKIYDTNILKKSYVALDNLSFKVPPGKITGFLGPNGAGKTTTVKIILGFIQANSGIVTYDGVLGGTIKSALKHIGYAPERPYFYPQITGNDFINYLGSLSGMKKNQIITSRDYWAPRLKIDHALNKKLNTYSKGMLQRIGFLTAVLNNPKLLLLDEPASGLDPLGRKELKDAIKEINQLGTTVFFSTHIVSDVEEICSDLVLVKNGVCAYQGSIKELIFNKSLKSYRVKFFENEDLKEQILEDHQLQGFLKELTTKSLKIYSVEPKQLTLEEIIYDTSRSNNA